MRRTQEGGLTMLTPTNTMPNDCDMGQPHSQPDPRGSIIVKGITTMDHPKPPIAGLVLVVISGVLSWVAWTSSATWIYGIAFIVALGAFGIFGIWVHQKAMHSDSHIFKFLDRIRAYAAHE